MLQTENVVTLKTGKENGRKSQEGPHQVLLFLSS